MLWQSDAVETFSAAWWQQHLVAVGVTFAIAAACTIVGRRWARRDRRRASAAGDDREGRKLRRRATITGLASGAVIAIAWALFVVQVLSALGVDLGPLVVSAGIVGVALGFGAQTLVRDAISGLFLFVEAQYDVGDVVDLITSDATVSGTVESLTVRTTSVRQFDGTLTTVPNGAITVVQNRTRGWGRAIIDVPVALGEDPERVRSVFEDLLAELEAQPPLVDWARESPKVLGVTQLTDRSQIVRVVAETGPSHRIEAERFLREKLSARLTEAGIASPPPAPPGV
jgi:small conductance mechanosensitive channel